MPSTLIVCKLKSIVEGCTIKAWAAVVTRQCVRCPDECPFKSAKVEFCQGKEYHGN